MADTARKGLISQFIEQYRQWSGPIRIVFWIAITLIAYFGLIEPAWTSTRSLNASSEALLQDIQNLKSGSAEDRETIRNGLDQWGKRPIPGRSGPDDNATLQKVLTSVLDSHGIISGVTIKDIGFDDVSLITRNESASGGQFTLRKLRTQVQFAARPDVLSAALADLEKHPSVASIQRITVRRNTSRALLEVTLVAQSWQRR